MGFIIEGEKVNVELRAESFYITDKDGLIELEYKALEELQDLLYQITQHNRYKEWKIKDEINSKRNK